jgi:hypothetical protein
MLHYFQGYHDIVQVLLLVLGIDAAPPAVARLSLLRIRDFMLPTMSGTEPHLRLLPAILYASDRNLATHLSQTQPFFALPATLTLYAHQIEEYGEISRLFDFLLASEAAVSVYLFAAVSSVVAHYFYSPAADQYRRLSYHERVSFSKLKPMNLKCSTQSYRNFPSHLTWSISYARPSSCFNDILRHVFLDGHGHGSPPTVF